MKKIIGSLMCLAAAARIASLIILPPAGTSEQRIQDWALAAVILVIGIALSREETAGPGLEIMRRKFWI